jgi:hypothetical protein
VPGEGVVAIFAGVIDAAALHLNGDDVGRFMVVNAAGLRIKIQAAGSLESLEAVRKKLETFDTRTLALTKNRKSHSSLAASAREDDSKIRLHEDRRSRPR